MTNEDFLRDWLQKVWIDQDFKAAEAAFSPQTEMSPVAGDLKMQPNDYETMVSAICRNFRPHRFTLDHVISKGSEISGLFTVYGRRLDTDAEATLTVHLYRKIENGKFVRSASSPDYIGLFKSLGQLPEDTMQTLMMGGRLYETFT